MEGFCNGLTIVGFFLFGTVGFYASVLTIGTYYSKNNKH